MDVIQAFSQLDHGTKIEKLKHLVEIFSPYSVVARDTLTLIQRYSDPLSEEEMIHLYSIFVHAVQDTNVNNLNEAIQQISSIQQKLSMIREAEAAEREQEDVDQILSSL